MTTITRKGKTHGGKCQKKLEVVTKSPFHLPELYDLIMMVSRLLLLMKGLNACVPYTYDE